MSDTGSGAAEAPRAAALAARDCPDGVAEAATRFVDSDGRPWERELLLAVFDAFSEPPAARREALEAATAVELFGGYRRTRTPFGTDGGDDIPSPERRRRLLLAGDALLALAFETVGRLSVDPPVVEDCVETTVRAATASAHAQSSVPATDGGTSGRSPPTREGDTDKFGADIGGLAAELGSVLGGACERTRREMRGCGRVIGATIAGDVDGRDRCDGEWRAARRAVDAVEDTRARAALTAFVDGHADDG